MNIFVAKLDFKTTSEELRALFEQFGAVNSAKVIIDHETGKSRGFGFVEMEADADGNHAIEELDGAEFQDRTIAVKVATPQARGQQNFGNNNRGGNNRY
jgi:RNA recognition motif-containing protein